MTQPVSAGGRLSDEELRELSRLLARYAEHDLDQWERWKVLVPGWGTVYVALNLELRSDDNEKMYDTIWPLPPKLAVATD